MNLFNLLNIKNNSNLEIIKAASVKEKLNAFLAPQLNELGLIHWNKNYQWSSDFNEFGIKHIVEYISLKGVSGTFQSGNSFNFIPNLNNKGKLIENHSTLQLFERAKGWHATFESDQNKTNYRVLHWNEHFFDKSLPVIFDKEKNQMVDWFKTNENIEQNIQTALKQMKAGGAYDIHSPNQKIVLAFLYAKIGELNLAKNTLQDYYKPLIKSDTLLKAEFEKMEMAILKINSFDEY